MKRFVLFNGPPGSGKDEAAKIMRRHYNIFEMKASLPLKRALPELFCLTHEQAAEAEKTKNEPSPLFYGRSFREMQIALSEDFMKVDFGEDIFGKLLIRKMKQVQGEFDFFVSSDAGFRSEWEPMIRWQGGKNFMLIRLHREGCDYSKDSRSYIELADLGVTEVDIDNRFDLEMYEQQILRHVRRWGPNGPIH